MWTHFMDMHSGGGTKVKPYEHIFIEAPEAEAKVIFYNRFNRNPERVTCTCCGEDYSISEHTDLLQATGYERGCAYVYFTEDGVEVEPEGLIAPKGKDGNYLRGAYVERKAQFFAFREYQTLEDYMKRNDVIFVPAAQIEQHEKTGSVPPEGFMWV